MASSQTCSSLPDLECLARNGQLSYQERSNRCEERTKNKERSTEPATGGKKGVNVKKKKKERRNEKAHKALGSTGSI